MYFLLPSAVTQTGSDVKKQVQLDVIPYFNCTVLILTPDEITDLEHIVAVLKPFAQATTMLSVEKSPSLSLVQPMLCALRKKALIVSEADPKMITDMKIEIADVFDQYFSDP